MNRVLIAHPESEIRRKFSRKLDSKESIEVVAHVKDPKNFFEKVKDFRPDVILMGAKFDTISGLDLLDRLMRTEPVPALSITSGDKKEQEEAVRALSYGAIDLVSPEDSPDEIAALIELAKEMKKEKHWQNAPPEVPSPSRESNRVVVIGSSTGGPSTLEYILKHLPEELPAPVLIAQHMSPRYTRIFTERVNSLAKIELKEAEDGEYVKRNRVYMAPGDKDMTVWDEGDGLKIRLQEPSHSPTPSIDELFKSVSSAVGPETIGVVLTGMGKDGVVGSRFIKAEGGTLLVQDEETSQIFGIGKHVVAQGDADEVLPLKDIPGHIMRCL